METSFIIILYWELRYFRLLFYIGNFVNFVYQLLLLLFFSNVNTKH